jgi:hypothetical protein
LKIVLQKSSSLWDIDKSRLIISKITKGLLIHVIHYILGDAYIEIKSLLKRISYQPRMKVSVTLIDAGD